MSQKMIIFSRMEKKAGKLKQGDGGLSKLYKVCQRSEFDTLMSRLCLNQWSYALGLTLTEQICLFNQNLSVWL